MATLVEIQKQISEVTSSAVTLGNFDGVHEGHRAIFKSLADTSKKQNLTPLVFVLFPHPKEFFTGSSPALLTNLESRIRLIRECGIDHVFDLIFDQLLANMTSQALLGMFQQQFRMKHLVIGPTTHMGKNRDGTPEKIHEMSKVMNFGLTIVSHLEIKGCKVSSSQIREYVLKGEMRMVADLLGRLYSTTGIVETGAGKGRTIGFPTANVAKIQTLVPARGVYAGYGLLRGQRYKAAINIGMRPTVTNDKKMVVECHLIDFNDKIVGETLEIQWVEKLRDEVKFESIDQLKIQIERDVRKARDIL
jgi:riboflavin kinase/FMN adenylyltransferase